MLSISSVFGTAKATQEADNVIILQYFDGKKVLDVKKNRFIGELGSARIEFDKQSQTFKQVESINPELKSREVKIDTKKRRTSSKKKKSLIEESDFLTQ